MHLSTINSNSTTLIMQAANRIYSAIQKGTSFGAWQMLPGHNHARQLCSSGVDWVLVDCEHGNIDDSAMHEAVTTIASQGVS
jgi:4-hydroxy-2-oxoheptanedioate aldolase